MQVGFIMDILTIPTETGASDALLSAAIKYFELKKMDIVGSLMLPSSRYSYNLKQAGFVKAPSKLLPQNMYLGVCSFTPSQPTDSLANANNWFISWGDHDVI